jgi:hypothetical protein
MTDLLMTCGRCYTDVNIHVEHAVLRVNTTPEPKGELLFLCPRCKLPDVQTLGARIMALLLQVGVPPVALGEPALDPSDLPPAGPTFSWEDLLEWHQQLESTCSVDPWT